MSWTYSALKTAIKDYVENEESSFVTHLDDFIKTTEERILKESNWITLLRMLQEQQLPMIHI